MILIDLTLAKSNQKRLKVQKVQKVQNLNSTTLLFNFTKYEIIGYLGDKAH